MSAVERSNEPEPFGGYSIAYGISTSPRRAINSDERMVMRRVRDNNDHPQATEELTAKANEHHAALKSQVHEQRATSAKSRDIAKQERDNGYFDRNPQKPMQGRIASPFDRRDKYDEKTKNADGSARFASKLSEKPPKSPEAREYLAEIVKQKGEIAERRAQDEADYKMGEASIADHMDHLKSPQKARVSREHSAIGTHERRQMSREHRAQSA